MTDGKLFDYWLIHRYFDDEIKKYFNIKDFKFNKDSLTLSIRNKELNLNNIIRILQNDYVVIMDEDYWEYYHPIFKQINPYLKNVKKDTLIFAFHVKNEVMMIFTKPINDKHWNAIETYFSAMFPAINKEKFNDFKCMKNFQFGIINFKRVRENLTLEAVKVFSVKKDILKN